MTARDFLGNERIAELESKGYSPEYIKALAKEQYEAKKKEFADSGVREDIAKMAIAQKLDAENTKKLNDEATAGASDRFLRNVFDTSGDEKAVDEADQRWRELNPDKIDIASRVGRLINRINPLTIGPKITGKAVDIKQNGLTADSLDKDFALFAGVGKFPNQFGRAVNTGGEWISDKLGAEGAKQFFGENRKFFDDNVKELDRIIAENNKEWGEVGGAIDPFLAAPAGIFTKGAKLANIAKSAGTGFAMGVGMNELRNAGDDKISTGQRLGDDLLSGLVMGGANALFSALSRGKVNNVSNFTEDLRGTPKAADAGQRAAGGAEGAAKAADDAAALDDALDGLGGAQKEGAGSASQELKASDAAQGAQEAKAGELAKTNASDAAGGEQSVARAADDAAHTADDTASAPQGAQEIKAAGGTQEIKSSPSSTAQGAQNAEAASGAQSNFEPREQVRQYLKTQNVADAAADEILGELERGARRSAHLSESAYKKADELYERANRLEWAREYQSRVADRASELAQMRADGIERFAAIQREAEKIAKENPTLSARAQRELLNSRIKPTEAELQYTRAYNDGVDVDPIYAGQNFIWRVENDIKAHPYTTEQYGARLASKGFAPDVQAAAMQAYDEGDIKFLKNYIDAKVAKAEYDDIVNNQMKDWIIKDGKIRRAQNGKANADAAYRGADANGAGAGGKDERVSKGVSDLGDTPSRAERGPGGDAQVSSQRGSAAILGGEDAKNAAGDELVGRYGAASGDSAADAAASKQRVVSAQDAADQGDAALKSESQGGDLAAKEGAGSTKQGAKLGEDMKKGFVNVNLTSHLAGGLSGGALNATDEEGKFSPERFAVGFIGGLGGVAVIRKGFRASMKAYAAKQAKTYPALANDRPDLFAQALGDEIKSRAKTTLFNAAEFAKTKVANKTGLDFEPQIFAGEKAYAELKYAPVKADKLSKAQAMAKEGKNELEIWRDTGWFRDKDGAWKFEIGDGDAKLNPKFQSGGKLGNLLKYDELFKAYPELRDVKVVKMQSDAPSGAMLAKDAGQKEKRGIYNVTYNNKIATYVKQDLDQIEGALRYARGDRSEGAKHIKIRHLNDEGSEGYVSKKELLDLGESMRKYLAKYKEPFINKRNARVYEWQDDKGVRFRLVASNKSAGTPYTAELPRPADFEDIITFYSDRNLKKPMEFENPKVRYDANLQNWHEHSTTSSAMLAKELEKKYLLKDGQINRSVVAKEAAPFVKKEYTFENFKADFPQGKAQTPIGEVNIGSFQFKKLQIKGREKYLGLIKPTLEKPSFIVDFEDTTFFFKAFTDEKGVVKFASVTKERNGAIDVTSNYPMAGRKFELLIREGKVRYTAQSSGDIKSLEHSLNGEEIISQNSKNGNNLGYFDPQSNTIALKNLKDRSTLMHEIQHWVQSKEGFATGGAGGDANYAKLHGEAEARNVQTRLGLDDAARAQKDPLSTFDVSPDDTIVLRDGGVNANEEPLKFRASEIENIGGEIKKRRPNIEQELEQSVEQIYKDSYKDHDTAGEVLDAVRTGNFDALSQGVQTNLSESQLARLKKDIAGAKLTHISRDGFTFKKRGKNGDEQMIFIDMDEGGRARINAYSKAHIDESIRTNETMFDRLFGDDEALKNYSFETKAKFLNEKDPIKAEQILKKADQRRFAAQIANKSKQEQEKLQAEYARAARQADPFNPDMPTMNDLLGKTDALLGSYGGADGKWAQFVDTLWRKGINKYENAVDHIFEGENTPAWVKKGMSVLDLRNAAKREIDGAIESFFRESAAINAQARTAAKYLDKFDAAQSEQLFNALDGKIAKTDLPEELQATYQKLRDAIDHNANELIKAGALKQENKLTDYIGHYYDEYMQNERGKISRTLGKFYARKDLSEAQKRALGLRTDISFVVANTLAKQRTQLLKARALEGIANRFGLDEIPAAAKQGQYVRISDETVGGGIKKFGALGGKYVPKEVAEALKSTQALGGQLGALEKYWQPLIDHIKVNVTVKNPFTHVYNVASNAVLAFLHGDEKALASWALLGRQQRQEYWKLARRLGLDSAMDDLEGAIKGLKPKNDAEAFGIVGKAMDFLSTAGKNIYMSEGSAVGRAARKAYAWEDEIFKIARFKKNLDAIAAKRGYAAGDLSKFSEKELAAAMSDAQYHYVDYSTHFNGFLRKSDKWGLMPFLHYSVKSTPMVIKAILKNPHRFAMMQAAFIAADAAGLSLSSIIADTEKENLTKPKWAQSSKFPNVFGLKAWARIGDSDTYFNAGRAAPGFRFDDVFEGGWGFVGGLVNIANGKSTLGYNITSEDDPKAVKVAKSVKEAAKNYLPTLTIGRYGQQLGEQALSDITGDKDFAPKDYNKDELGYAGILKRGVGARRFNQQKELNAELGKLRKQREELEYVKVPDSKDADKVEKAIKHNEKLEKMSASEKAEKQKQIDRKLEIFKEVADAEGFEFDVQSLKRLRDEKKQRKFAPKKFDPALISRPQIGKFSQ
ncbi:LPD23 domain-containing protein [uncultured Campylobacter sp.]|uniref:LPD23 domain-containing protein n=1 Tax=uncultured Campylobacter sp. TaxID=218934 RepID=UPI0026217C57|nr:LPD23 domain-containing protein [uncultured Campylobacter sp.]